MSDPADRASAVTRDGFRCLATEPLSAAAFAEFGEVIEARSDQAVGVAINDGTAQRFDDVASVDVGTGGGRTRVSLVRVGAQSLPIDVRLMERHPLGSQAFVPLAGQRLLVVVAVDPPRPEGVRAFVSNGRQGINYHRGTWHHPLITLDAGDLLMVDRGGPGDNLEELPFVHHRLRIDGVS